MELLRTVFIVVDVVSAIALVILILLQQGKGASVGAAFGSGASGTVFGAGGSANFLSRTTAILVTVFFICSIGLSYISLNSQGAASSSTILDRINTDTTPSANQMSTPSQESVPSSFFDSAPEENPDNVIKDAIQQIPKQ